MYKTYGLRYIELLQERGLLDGKLSINYIVGNMELVNVVSQYPCWLENSFQSLSKGVLSASD